MYLKIHLKHFDYKSFYSLIGIQHYRRLDYHYHGTDCLETVEAGDLCLRDLGYFDLGDLQVIHDKEAYYISRLKLNTRIYIKDPEPEYFNNGTLKKQTEYIQLDMTQMMSSLPPGETLEIPDAYIGQNQKLPARVIIQSFNPRSNANTSEKPSDT